MIRAFAFFAVLGALIWGAMMLSDHPGAVSLEWAGYRIETSFAVLLSAVALVSFAVALVYRFWLFLRRSPGTMKESWIARRRVRGYQALTRGMVAVAAGDADEAHRQAKRADTLLDEPPLTMLVSAQAAQMRGDEAAAGSFFAAMMKRPETEFLGLRGLFNQAIKRGDQLEALSLARRAHRLEPKSTWVAGSLFDLQIRTGQWLDARVTCDDLRRRKLIDAATAKRRIAVLNYQLGLDARDAGDLSAAESHLRDANKQAPDFIPAVVDLARHWVDAGKASKAGRMIASSWAASPHPAMLESYWTALGALDALDRVRAAKKLTASNPDHPESLMALARASLEARLWGEARQSLDTAIALAPEPPGRVCRLMAALEDSENPDTGRAREWLVRASTASADPLWVCDHCGNGVADWSVTCGKCGEFDSFYWRPPPSIAGLMEPHHGNDADDDADDATDKNRDRPASLIDAGGAAILPAGGSGAG
ncbi:MAG: heme biosynthesis protein HemY [Rhodospirillales bacterium]|nr:heme biosynthesis protein HemY [Rhodospirillales bacterium]